MENMACTNHTPSSEGDHTHYNNDVINIFSSLSSLIINSRATDHHTQYNGLLTKLHLNGPHTPLYIEVTGQPKGLNESKPVYSILIERWRFETITRTSATGSNMTVLPFLAQAIRSFLHFSQISSWAISCGGHLPFDITNSIGSTVMTSHESSCPLDTHLFPLVSLSHLMCLQVSVEHLPRLDQIPPLLLPSDDSDIISDVTSSHMTKPSDTPTLFPFSPPTPSPLSPKLFSNNLVAKGLSSESPTNVSSADNVSSATSSRCIISNISPILIPKSSHSSNHMTTSNGITGSSTGIICSSTSITATSNGITGSSTGLMEGWRGSVRPPGASSPVPHIIRNNKHGDSDRKMKRRSCIINYKSPTKATPQRSMSLPAAVPSMCLLGTFEESVLNGRIDPLGYVEGFTAELGASGSFCPDHTVLPVTACYFQLSDDGGPSPYLGHIDLSNVGRRGYCIPPTGTIQLTLFNPNKTVVKIFIVKYDHTDMPCNTSTFIRQKTYSRPYHVTSTTTTDSFCCLHYLIHLRFLSSKSHRIYLHTDIKLIFARRAPDTDPDVSKVSLYTIEEGPSNPKYGPLTSE